VIALFRPLGIALLAFLAGSVPALRFSPDPLPLILAATAAAVLALVSSRARRFTAGSRAAIVVVAFVAAGAAVGAEGAQRAAADCRAWVPDGAALVATGRLGAGTAPINSLVAGLNPVLPLEDATLAVGSASMAGGGAAAASHVECEGSIRVRMPDGTATVPAGTAVTLTGVWRRSSGRVTGTGWPRDPFYAGYIVVDSIIAVAEPDFASGPLLAMRGGTETALRELFPDHSALAEGLLLGRRERIDPELQERFTRSGLVHLLAISGSHVGLFAAMLLIVGGAMRMSRQRVAWMCIVIIAAYLAMIGAPASAIRSGIMLSLALVAVVLQRPAAAIPMMSAAALAILAFDPAAALDAGFQLSFAGVIGIMIARRVVLDAIPRRWVSKPPARWLVESITISVAAFAATAPIVAHHFGQIAPVAIIANLIAVPATALALCGVVGAVALYPILPPVASLVADGTSVALDVLNRTATIAADLPLGHLPVPRPDWLAWIAACTAAAAAWAYARRLPPRPRWIVAAGALGAILLAWPALARDAQRPLEIHFIDVGQGDAIAIRTPLDRWLLFDAGPRSEMFDAGQRRVVPFLHSRGVRRIEALILTHPHADHIGGAAAVLRTFPVGLVIDPGFTVGRELYAEVLELVEVRGTRWSVARAGRTLRVDGLELAFLWPDSAFLDDTDEPNDISAVVRISYGDFEMLMMGDAPAEVEHILVAREGGELRAEIVKAGHHGSRTSTSAALLTAVRPELMVITVGRRNLYGHPAPDVVRRIAAHGIDIARTDHDGTVSIRVIDGAGWVRVEQ
jgi:competence protein ComEC